MSLARHLWPRLVDRLRNTDALALREEFLASQWLSSEAIHALQWQRLQSLLRHAFNHVPYYRRLMLEQGASPELIRSWEDFQRLPTLSKADINRNPPDFHANNAARFQPRPKATGGSTGEPLRYWIDRRSHSASWAFIYRAWAQAGWRPGDPVVVLGGSSLVPSMSALKKWAYVRLNNWLLLSAFAMDASRMAGWVLRIRRSRARIMYAYASSAYLFARFLEERGITGVTFQAVFTTAEVLHPLYRETIERVFSCRVFDTYGGVDGAGFAFECERHDGLHIVAENAVVEILREDGTPADDGETGEVVSTDLFNYAMPFIRYRVGDRAAMRHDPCPCGRGLPRLTAIQGRVGDFLVTRNGERVHEQFFGHVFRGVSGVRQYYVEQNSLETVSVYVIPEPGVLTERELERVSRLIRAKFDGTDVTLSQVESLPARPNGKFRCVVNSLPAEAAV